MIPEIPSKEKFGKNKVKDRKQSCDDCLSTHLLKYQRKLEHILTLNSGIRKYGEFCLSAGIS